MVHFLKNIAQNSLPRTILVIVLGVAMWVTSLIIQENRLPICITLALTIVNSYLVTQYFYKGKITALPSMFVASTYWFSMSVLPLLHSCWQAQMIVLGIFASLLILSKMNYQHEATEESFLATLVFCIVAPQQVVLMTGVMLIWWEITAKGHMSLRVWLASMIAIAIRVVLMLVLHYMGWMEILWMENIPRMTMIEWIAFGGVLLSSLSVSFLSIKKPSIATGVTYIVFILLLITIGTGMTFLQH